MTRRTCESGVRGWWLVMSERPPNCDSRDVQRAVNERLRERRGSEPADWQPSVDVVVWETLALLGEWELIELGDL